MKSETNAKNTRFYALGITGFTAALLALLLNFATTRDAPSSPDQFASDLATHVIGTPLGAELTVLLTDRTSAEQARCQFTAVRTGSKVETEAADLKTACAQAALTMKQLCAEGKC